ncbi:hypothetical protein CP960_00045 [Malaciobacter halophilus]|uniref:Rhodanese domain-containing protein n=1 Tax=Malaciobacter halophilus TaxID=197482 RepID=A0A2N1J6L5_9BACT|nr:hypothetical protein [Malaciobacter halophilus]AXH09963.1 hypothetical protein AHALO_1597 [Malaciobacter halophilus]PKI82181.1 hypothetical protein CP960_00045 [Malaciobacter halophilus]
MLEKDEWTQEELFKYSKELKKQGKKVVVIDTILKPLDNIETITYNPFEMKDYPHGTVFVFYCDTGKTTKERLNFYRKKFPEYVCVSLRGGKGYWRPNFQLLQELKKNV